MSKLYIGTSTLKKFQLPIFFKILLYYSIISGNKDANFLHSLFKNTTGIYSNNFEILKAKRVLRLTSDSLLKTQPIKHCYFTTCPIIGIIGACSRPAQNIHASYTNPGP